MHANAVISPTIPAVEARFDTRVMVASSGPTNRRRCWYLFL